MCCAVGGGRWKAKKGEDDRIKNWGLILSSATLLFVGWVEPISRYVGFRYTQPNLHVVSSIVQCETQQWPILEPSPKIGREDSWRIKR